MLARRLRASDANRPNVLARVFGRHQGLDLLPEHAREADSALERRARAAQGAPEGRAAVGIREGGLDGQGGPGALLSIQQVFGGEEAAEEARGAERRRRVGEGHERELEVEGEAGTTGRKQAGRQRERKDAPAASEGVIELVVERRGEAGAVVAAHRPDAAGSANATALAEGLDGEVVEVVDAVEAAIVSAIDSEAVKTRIVEHQGIALELELEP